MSVFNRRLSPDMSKVDLWHIHSDILFGNPLQIAVSANQLFNMQVRQNVSANGDMWQQDCYLKYGTWDMSVLYIKIAAGGICQLTVFDDDVIDLQVNMDTYGAGVTFNQFFGQTFTVRNSGFHHIRGEIVGHTAPSTSYDAYISLISLTRIGN